MYNPARAPWVSHFEGNTLFRDYIERFVCPTVTSDSVLAEEDSPFEFAGVAVAEASLAASAALSMEEILAIRK
jgi:hypothetical protein